VGDEHEILVEAAGGRITVRLRGTSMKAVYTKGSDPWLTLAETVEDKDAPINLSQFRVLAWEAANKKAKELSWIA
jgi:hypothetical protein